MDREYHEEHLGLPFEVAVPSYRSHRKGDVSSHELSVVVHNCAAVSGH